MNLRYFVDLLSDASYLGGPSVDMTIIDICSYDEGDILYAGPVDAIPYEFLNEKLEGIILPFDDYNLTVFV